MSNTIETAGLVEPPKPKGMNGRVVWHAVRARPLAFVLVAVLATGVAAAVWFFLPLPKVTAAVVFHVATRAPSILPSGSEETGVPFASYKQSQAAQVKSRLNLNAALNQPGVSGLQLWATAEPDKLAWLERKLIVDSKSTSEYMRVTIEGEDGEDLMVLLQAVAKSYHASVKERDNGARKQRLAQLETSQREYRAEVERFQTQVDKIALALGTTDGGTLVVLDSLHKENLRLASNDQSNARHQHLLAKGELEAWDAANTQKPGEPVPAVVVPESAITREFQQDRLMLDFEAAVARASQDLRQAEKDFGAGSPALTRAAERVQDAQAKRDKYRADQRTVIEARLRENHGQAEKDRRIGLHNKVVAAGQRELVAVERVKTIQREIGEFSKYRLDLEKARRLSDQNEKLSSLLTHEIERLKLELGAPPRVTIADEPYLVTGLEGNRRLKFSLMAGLGVFALGFVGLVAWESRSRRVTHHDEVTADLGLVLLGTVPSSSEVQSAVARGALVEAIDTTRTMMIHRNPAGNPLRTVIVTSAVTGEGKTSLSGHLAISLARAGYNTLLIDGDLQSPSAHKLFDLPSGPGLCELLRAEVEPATAVRATSFPGLTVLPAGALDLAARQALAGARWRAIRQQLESQYDYIVIDTAPLLLVSDTLLLSREADGVVLSVLLGVSRVGDVAETVARLRAIGANITGAVVNGVWQEAYRASARYSGAIGSSAQLPPVAAGSKE